MIYQSTDIPKIEYVPMTEARKEEIEKKLDDQLKDAVLWFGGFDALRERIKVLEDNANEAAWYRSQNDY